MKIGEGYLDAQRVLLACASYASSVEIGLVSRVQERMLEDMAEDGEAHIVLSNLRATLASDGHMSQLRLAQISRFMHNLGA